MAPKPQCAECKAPIPPLVIAAAQSRGSEAKYCSPRCRGIFNTKKWAAKVAAQKKRAEEK